MGALVPLLHSAQPGCPFDQPPQRGGFKEFVGQGGRQRGGDYESVPRIESGADKLLPNLFLARLRATGSLFPPFPAQVVELVDTQVSEACA